VLSQWARTGEKIWVTPAGLTGLARRSSTTRAGLTGLATQSSKQEVLVGLLTRKAGLWKIWLTRRARLHGIQPTWKAGLRKIRLTQKIRLCKTRGLGTGRRKRCYVKQKASSRVVPKGYYQEKKMQNAKDASKRVG
jgi:hypothetical protein